MLMEGGGVKCPTVISSSKTPADKISTAISMSSKSNFDVDDVTGSPLYRK